MKSYKFFIVVFVLVLTLYIIAEANRPQPFDWSVTLSKGDKNPYGSFVLYSRLKDLFPSASVESFRTPVYNQLNNFNEENTAYLLCDEKLKVSENDVEEMLSFVTKGNHLFISASRVAKNLSDTLHYDTDRNLIEFTKDSTRLQFTDPTLSAKGDYTFLRNSIDEYFTKYDTAVTTVLGKNNFGKVNFIRMTMGNGFIYLHANPLVFSNYFMLTDNNASYTAMVLSYIPKTVKKVYWDEYYKLGPLGAATPLRFFLSNDYLRWALRLAVIGMLLYVLFEMKRRQRIIPVITPLRNTTVGFIRTIATVYLQQKDNNSIAAKKITYFLEFVRNKYFIPTVLLDEDFIEHLSRKSGVGKHDTEALVQLIGSVQTAQQVPDTYLLVLNDKIDQFYKQVQ